MNGSRAGFYRKNLSGEQGYLSFVPAPLPPDPPIVYSQTLVRQLVSANKQLQLLDGIVSRIPSIRLFVSMYVRKEALLSSQIEGTQATLEDVLDPTMDCNANRNVADVINYIKATEFALQRRQTLPLCNRLIRQTHEVLMEGVRGQEKSPGEFRRSQNWIGGAGSTLNTARYIPPNAEDMNAAMSDLEKFINADDSFDPIVKAALIHYQFETIHPFLDGNGRVGRLLITLFLMEKRALSSPALYISYFLKLNRIEYYDRMTRVRESGDYEQWVLFFLEAVADSAQDALQTIDALCALRAENEQQLEVYTGRTKAFMLRLLEYLANNPIIEIRRTAQEMGVAFNTAAKAVERLVAQGVLVQSGKSGRARTFSYKAYLDILRKGT